MQISLIQPAPIGPSLGTVDFPAQISDPCLADEVKFTNTAQAPIPYVIRNNPTVLDCAPTVSQRFALCPLECEVGETSSGKIPFFVYTFTTTPYYIPGPNPSVEKQTAVL